jgi:hypothetical protein
MVAPDPHTRGELTPENRSTPKSWFPTDKKEWTSDVRGSDEDRLALRAWLEKAEASSGALAPPAAFHYAREELLRRRKETKIEKEPAYVRSIVTRYLQELSARPSESWSRAVVETRTKDGEGPSDDDIPF